MPGSSFFLSQVSAGLSSEAAWPDDLFHDRMSTAEINSIGPWKMVWCGMDLSVRTVGVLEIERKSVSPNLVS